MVVNKMYIFIMLINIKKLYDSSLTITIYFKNNLCLILIIFNYGTTIMYFVCLLFITLFVSVNFLDILIFVLIM